MKKLIIPWLVLFAALGVRGGPIASYTDGTAADTAALTNLAPPVSGIAAVSDLAGKGFEGSLNPTASTTRNEFGGTPTPAGPTAGSAAGSEWLFARSSFMGDAPGTTTDYFGFTVTADAGKTLTFDSFTFDLVGINNANSTPWTFTAQLFVAVDGGAFTSIGSAVTSNATDTEDEFAAVKSVTIDLSGMAGANSVEFRLELGDDLKSSSRAAYVQGIQLNGTVVP
jgi:hypothetical protein